MRESTFGEKGRGSEPVTLGYEYEIRELHLVLDTEAGAIAKIQCHPINLSPGSTRRARSATSAGLHKQF